jgi:hypothetical protein
MEDINNALLHIKAKHNGEIPYQYGSKECAKLMDSYAKEYHERKLKLLGIADVVGRREQYCDCQEIIVADYIDKKHCSICDKPMDSL